MRNEQEFDLLTRFPLSWHSHEAGWHDLFDLAILGKSLNCAPGDHILDFACGPGYVSEILNRFGYYTTALDINPEAVEIAQARFLRDKRLDGKRAAFVVSDALSMPFPDAFFDGVVCMNAFHHMPDYGRAFREIARVLKPGRRLVMSEPGSLHAKTQLSRVMVEQHGDLEKSIYIEEMFQLAFEAGFAETYLLPYLYPEHFIMSQGEWQEVKSGRVCGTCLDPSFLTEVIAGTHPIFVFVKPGKLPLTSRNPGVLKEEITIEEFAFYQEPVLHVVFKAKVKNLGDCLWFSEAREFGGYMTLGAKILNNEGKLRGEALNRIWLPRDVPPQDEVMLSGVMQLGELPPGKYTLRFDMVDEFVCWLEERSTGYAEVMINIENDNI